MKQVLICILFLAQLSAKAQWDTLRFKEKTGITNGVSNITFSSNQATATSARPYSVPGTMYGQKSDLTTEVRRHSSMVVIWIIDTTGNLIFSSDEHGLIIKDSLKAINKLADLVRMNYERLERVCAKLDQKNK